MSSQNKECKCVYDTYDTNRCVCVCVCVRAHVYVCVCSDGVSQSLLSCQAFA